MPETRLGIPVQLFEISRRREDRIARCLEFLRTMGYQEQLGAPKVVSLLRLNNGLANEDGDLPAACICIGWSMGCGH